MLAADSGVLCRETVLPYMKAQVALVTPGAVDSTNNVAKQLAQQGAPHGTVVLSAISRPQAGAGWGRRFESPEGGIYVSILLRPQLPAQEGVRLTLGACVGVCRAMEQADGLQGQIKWVNDVYLEWEKGLRHPHRGGHQRGKRDAGVCDRRGGGELYGAAGGVPAGAKGYCREPVWPPPRAALCPGTAWPPC